ncbi:MAG: flagellar basal body P-ring protein FlgI [Deltaproteobacteria bacterium]|nr:flagellar basal body P-ring protein FlgI [Deltaproteobacteria bacterium]
MKYCSKAQIIILSLFLVTLHFFNCSTVLSARIKDIASLKGVRSNQLVGYGLVVGLNGTGDGSGTRFTTQSLVNMMERMGIHSLSDQIKVANVAGVIVTAYLPPFSRKGSEIDITVSSIGDAKSLHGGTLLMTPLKGADGNVYALAQGPLFVGGFSATGTAGGGVQKNHPTVARIPGGAIIEREIPFDFNKMNNLTLALNSPDFTTSQRISRAINRNFGTILASSLDAGTVIIDVPESYQADLVSLVASLEQLEITPDNGAKVVLSERTGTVIMGENVTISSIAIAHGNLSVQIKEKKEVSQPLPFSEGETVITPDSDVNVSEDGNKLVLMETQGTDLGGVVRALNAIGISARDLITVLQAIKAAGALQAELEII